VANALARWEGDGGRAILVRATRSTASIPFGPFAPWAPDRADPSTNDRLDVLRAIARSVLESDRPVMVAVDDAHLLDDGSAALVLHLVAQSSANIVVTIRSGEPCPDAVTALWKDGLAALAWAMRTRAPLPRSVHRLLPSPGFSGNLMLTST
jgi:hypothetical protein